jgi:hypothetical protein
MSRPPDPPNVALPPWKALRPDAPASAETERLVRETWRHYYVARLAEAQFGPDSLEASIAHTRARESYRELHRSLHALDPIRYRSQGDPAGATPSRSHLRLVTDDPAEQDTALDS